MKNFALVLLLIGSSAKAADLRSAIPPGQRYTSSGTTGNFSSVYAQYGVKASTGDFNSLYAVKGSTAGSFYTTGASTAGYFYGDGSGLRGLTFTNTSPSSFTVLGIMRATGTVQADADKVYASTLGMGGVFVPYGVVATTGAIGTISLSSPTITLDVGGLLRVSNSIVTPGGNLRGSEAMDLQLARAINTQVASGQRSFIGGGNNNINDGAYGSIVAASGNTLQSGADYSGALSGRGNSIAGITDSVIVGGSGNSVLVGQAGAFIGGGITNSIGYTGTLAPTGPGVIVGGTLNTALNAGFVGGGSNNYATSYATCPGGSTNLCTGFYSTIAGGASGTASGNYSWIVGGNNNTASAQNAGAMGYRAKATAQGAISIADTTEADFTNAVADSLKARMSGGYYFTAGITTTTRVIVETSQSPASNAACNRGEFTWDASFGYICTATAVWKRFALTGGY
jgi:hypothetical protein